MKKFPRSAFRESAIDNAAIPMPTKKGGLVDFDKFFEQNSFIYSQPITINKVVQYKNQEKLIKLCSK